MDDIEIRLNWVLLFLFATIFVYTMLFINLETRISDLEHGIDMAIASTVR